MPGYWQNEIGPDLRPAIMLYLEGKPLTPKQVKVIQLYLKQWVDDGAWYSGEGLDWLRASVNQIGSVDDIERWLAVAMNEGIDPL